MIPWLWIQNTEKPAKLQNVTLVQYVHISAVMTASVKIGFWTKVQTNLSELYHNLHAMQRTWYWGDCKLSSECFWQLIYERWVKKLTIRGLLAKIENSDTHHMSNVRWCRRKGPYGRIFSIQKTLSLSFFRTQSWTWMPRSPKKITFSLLINLFEAVMLLSSIILSKFQW